METNSQDEQKPKRLKILCIHGTLTSAEFMEHQMRFWTKKFKNQLEFIFYQGNFVVDDRKIVVLTDLVSKKWHLQRGVPRRCHFEPGVFERQYAINTNLEPKHTNMLFKNLVEVINDHKGTIDGVIAFSRGAFFTFCFFDFLEQGFFKDLLKVKKVPYFAILIGSHPGWGNRISRVPSLHLVGTRDYIFTCSEVSLTRFKKAELMRYPGGHKFPLLTAEIVEGVLAFVESVRGDPSRYRVFVEKVYSRGEEGGGDDGTDRIIGGFSPKL